ncbi:MAG: ChbG/HpnK family deacetylase, partial [Terracidiphilus sp.]
GRFLPTLAAFLLRLFTGGIRAQEIAIEAAAQIAHLQRSGVRLTHIDTHKHVHVFPAVLRPVLGAARAAGIHAVRHPFEPDWAMRAAMGASLARVAQVAALSPLASPSRQIIAQEGFATSDGTIAVAGTGTLDGSTLRSLLRLLPAGIWELVTHPGYNDTELDNVRTRLRASRDVERQALPAIHEFPGIELISFAALARPSISASSGSVRAGL